MPFKVSKYESTELPKNSFKYNKYAQAITKHLSGQQAMLAYFLAILIAITSLILFLNAFISPKTHRQDDFLWSGLGLFYALILWLCAGIFTGAVLLGQIAVVAMTIAFVWENHKLRKVITAESESNEALAGFSLLSFVGQSLAQISQKEKTAPTTTPEAVVAEEKSEAIESKEKESTLTPTEEEAETEEIVGEEQPEEITTSETESALPSKEEADKTPTEEEEISESPVIKEEITTETEKQEEESQEEEEFLGSSLVTPSESKAKKTNIFSRILGIFRKSEPEKQEIKPSEKETEVKNQILDEDKTDTLEGDAVAEVSDVSENIEQQTTTTEVEETIENVELSETSEENLEEKEEAESEVSSSVEAIEDVSVTQEEVPVEEENDILTVTEEAEITTEDETISETTTETNEIEVEEKDKNVLETTEAKIETQISEETLEEAQVSVIEEEKEEMTTNESSSETTAEDVPEDDIIESLSDLFPNQDESAEKETKNNQSDEEIDKSEKND